MVRMWPPTWTACPFCEHDHLTKDAESNMEDIFYAYADCPQVGEVRVKYEFQDHFKRFKEIAMVV